MLRTVDLKWMDHIDALDQLSNSIRMRSIGQHDPVVEYKLEGSAMFEEMNENIQNDAVKFIMRARFTPETQIEAKPQVRDPWASGGLRYNKPLTTERSLL